MPAKNCNFLNRHIRKRYEAIFCEMKKLCKQEIQLTMKEQRVFFKWHTESPAHDIWAIERSSPKDAYKMVREGLCILDRQQQRECEESEIYLVCIYQPLFQSILNWATKENSRKTAITLMLKDLNKDDKRNFGERMRDLKKKNC